MSTLPPTPDLPEGADYPHPSWCDFAGTCTSPDALRVRGIDPASVPVFEQDMHSTPPRTVVATEPTDVDITFWAWSDCNQPPEEAERVAGVTMQIRYTDQQLVIGVPLAPGQIPVLREAFIEMTDLLDGHHTGGTS